MALRMISFGMLKEPWVICLLLSLAVMLPLLTPGYIFALDMAFGPHIPWPDHIGSSYVFYAGLHMLNLFIPSDVIQKMVLVAILFLSAYGMYWVVKRLPNSQGDHVAAYSAAVFYMANPYTYSRFMTGQFAVLLGYALLPFLLMSLLRYIARPTMRSALAVAAWGIGVGVVSVHSLGLAAIMAICVVTLGTWQNRQRPEHRRSLFRYGLVGVGVFLLASSYWLLPMAIGASNQGQAIAGFTAADQSAFATAGEGFAGKLGNVLQLQGFWAESQNLYLLPGEQVAFWSIIVLLWWVLIGIGVKVLWQRNRAITALCICMGILAVGVAITPLISLFADLPLVGGFREPHKFIGLLALVYAIAAGIGMQTIMRWAQTKNQAIAAGVSIVTLVIPLLLTPTMWWGFAGQLTPRSYPDDWFVMQDYLKHTAHKGVLFLPWHLYMHYPFTGRVTVDPAPIFFYDSGLITSNELEFKGASPTAPNTTKTYLTNRVLPNARTNGKFGADLHRLGITHVLLSKNFDYKNYDYLSTQTDMRTALSTPNLTLYEVRL